MKKLFANCLITLMLFGITLAQTDDPNIPFPPQKRADIAIAEVAAVNVLVWGFGHFILDGYWTQIGWESMDINLRHGFEWDPNMFKNNFNSHPYHGNIYFNAARTNGMNFWESTPFVFGGSLTWELFMESEFPSINDLVMTTIGGISLGEGLYRFSEQVLDDRARGGSRVWRELLGAALNPIGGFNRLVKGDMFRRLNAVNHIRNPLIGFVALGGRGRVTGSDFGKAQFNPALEVTLRYGDPFEYKDSRTPFDYFTFRVWTSQGSENRRTTILEQAVLVGKNFYSGKDDKQSHLLGLYQYYDYTNVEVVNYGGVSLGPGLLSQFPLSNNFTLSTGIHPGVLMMGGSDNEYFTNTQGRNYNYGWGFKGKAHIFLDHTKFGSFLAQYDYFGLRTLEGIDGTDHVQSLNLVYNLPLYRSFGLGLEYFYYHRNSKYTNFPDVKREIKGPRMLFTYAFY